MRVGLSGRVASPVDLTEVRTLVHLYETRSVTAAAELMNVTQPSVSYTLGKLRRRFDDDLFVRTPGGLEPTATAAGLLGPFRDALAALEQAVGGLEHFDPATTEREFTVMLSDFGELSFLPLLIARLADEAPRSLLRVEHLVVDDAADLLARGRLDLVVTSVPLPMDGLVRRPFMTVDYAVLAARSHPRIGRDRITARQFAKERYVSVRGTTGHLGPVDLIHRLDLESRVDLELTGFASVPYVVADSELLGIVPRHIAEIFAARHELVVLDLPWRLEPIQVAVYTRRSAGLAQKWLAETVVDALSRERFA